MWCGAGPSTWCIYSFELKNKKDKQSNCLFLPPIFYFYLSIVCLNAELPRQGVLNHK